MTTHDAQQARDAFEKQDWESAHESFTELDALGELTAEDLDRLAVAATLLGREPEVSSIRERALEGHLGNNDVPAAIRSGFWAASSYMNMGQIAQAGALLSRVVDLYEQHQPEDSAKGWIPSLQGRVAWMKGELETALEHMRQSVDLSKKFDDPDLSSLSRFGCGRLMIELGDIDTGLSLLDEALVLVTRGEASPLALGITYCGSISAFMDVFEHKRAREWTEVLHGWVNPQNGRTLFRGQCLVFRSEIMQLKGDWKEAFEESLLAVQELSGPYPTWFLATALYQLGELQRLKGDLESAEESYSKANEMGTLPQPGLALLRAGQGKLKAAEKSIRTAMEGAQDRITRSKLLTGFVEIMLAISDFASAAQGLDELIEIAGEAKSDFLNAHVLFARGSLSLAEGEPRKALSHLRDAVNMWVRLEAPYEAARTRVLIARACEDLDDMETCAMELSAARAVFERLGASTDLEQLGILQGKAPTGSAGLTGRELEVLALVATGKSNKSIARELFISQKTVARHVSNIFSKLDVTSRTEATSYAYEHGLT